MSSVVSDSLTSVVPWSSTDLTENVSIWKLDGNTSNSRESSSSDWNVVDLDFEVVVSIPESGNPVVSESHGFSVSW